MPAGRFTQAEVQRFIKGCQEQGLDVVEASMTIRPNGEVVFKAVERPPVPSNDTRKGPKQWGA